MSSRNMSSLKLPKKDLYEDYTGPFHMIVPCRHLTPITKKSRSPISVQKFYRMPAVRQKLSEGLKYSENDTSECTASSLSDPTDLYWHKIDVSTWKPETRQFSSLTFCSGQLHLIGGISKSIHSQVTLYHPTTKKWEKIESRGSVPRFGHSALEVNRKIIIFGGGTEYSESSKVRMCISGLYEYAGGNSAWEPLENKGIHISPRKFHAGCVVGRFLFIQGGMNNKNKLLNDSALYDFHKSGWISPSFAGPDPGFRAYHTAQCVINPDQSPSNSMVLNSTKFLNVKIPGVYLFGGVKEDGSISDELCVLDLSGTNPQWIRPQVTGPTPQSRVHHTMIFISNLSVLLIFGGKSSPQSGEEVFLNDVCLLRVDILHWNSVKVFGDVPCPRAGHVMEAIGSRIYIFGGISKAGYCSSAFYALELNPRTVKSYMQDERVYLRFNIP